MWAKSLADAAFHGLVAQSSRRLRLTPRQTPVAILGSVPARTWQCRRSEAAFRVEATRHHLILSRCWSATQPRRGRAVVDHVNRLFEQAEQAAREHGFKWRNRIVEGLFKRRRSDLGGSRIRVQATDESVQGVTDKRRIVLESEFGINAEGLAGEKATRCRRSSGRPGLR